MEIPQNVKERLLEKAIQNDGSLSEYSYGADTADPRYAFITYTAKDNKGKIRTIRMNMYRKINWELVAMVTAYFVLLVAFIFIVKECVGG